MTNLLSGLTMALIVAVAFNILYWNVIRPVLLKAVLFRIFERRDALRRMAITDQITVASPQFQYLQDFVCKTIAFIPNVSLLPFVYFAAKHRDEKNPDSEQFEIEASKEMKELKQDVVGYAFSMMVLNSPFLLFFALVLFPALWISLRLRIAFAVLVSDRDVPYRGDAQFSEPRWSFAGVMRWIADPVRTRIKKFFQSTEQFVNTFNGQLQPAFG